MFEGFERYSPSQPFTAQERLKEHAYPFVRRIKRAIAAGSMFIKCRLKRCLQVSVAHIATHQPSLSQATQETVIRSSILQDELAKF